jgi:carbamoyl-phosphate synthase small subunit
MILMVFHNCFQQLTLSGWSSMVRHRDGVAAAGQSACARSSRPNRLAARPNPLRDVARGNRPMTEAAWTEPLPTAVLVLADGTVIEGHGLGARGAAVGEVCFNTAMTGYQEILTDPSYAGQIITFTFPHIGNVGVNDEDIETVNMASASGVRGAVLRADVTEPSNWRASRHFSAWLAVRGIVGIAGVDTRALTALIREKGMPNAVIAHDPDGVFDLPALKAEAAAWGGLEGLDLAVEVTNTQAYRWDETQWQLGRGYGRQAVPKYRVVAIDYGVKRNILRILADLGCEVIVLPANATAEDVLAHEPDGVFLSNGPGDPAATGEYAVPTIRAVVDRGIPTFGICLGHQMLGLALGGRTVKMHQGHHGANHPVKDFTTGKVEITSMNHGFAVDPDSLPDNVEQTHVSLFDGSNCGLRLSDKPVFSVQYHPEASPGPRDSHYLFTRFVNLIRARKGEPALPERAA